VFSNKLTAGTNIKKYEKYKAVANCPINIYGASACRPPMAIKIKNVATKPKKIILEKGVNSLPLVLEKSVKGNTSNINREANIAITPNNLLGIDRKIA